MSLLRTELWPNGDIYTEVYYYTCNHCGKEICEAWPHWDAEVLDYHLCWNCAFIEGKILEDEYVKYGCSGLCNHATVINGEIILWKGKIPPWDPQRDRNTPQYKEWRTAVFQRDNYTCQKCGKTGGKLNAHHKVHWADNSDLRFNINNGITLCLACHKEAHKKKVS